MTTLRGCLLLITTCVTLSACMTLPADRPPPADNLAPSVTTMPAEQPTPRSTISVGIPSFTFGSDWTLSSPGVELRRLAGPPGASTIGVLAVRLDPAVVSFRMVYDRNQPRSISRWVADYDALIAVNAGYFDEAGQPVALLVSDSQAFGLSYRDKGGMFAVTADGQVELRPLSDQPYDGEPLQQALQGWPLLVRQPGLAAYDNEDGRRSRRTAIGIDTDGRVLLLVSPAADFSLAEWSGYLAAADLGLSAAVNLDGGASTGLALRNQRAASAVEAFVPLPFALLISER